MLKFCSFTAAYITPCFSVIVIRTIIKIDYKIDMSDQKRVFLVDAFALIFRGYYAFIKNPRCYKT